jgi:hypothetical protein
MGAALVDTGSQRGSLVDAWPPVGTAAVAHIHISAVNRAVEDVITIVLYWYV